METQQSPLDPEVGMARDEWRSHSHMSQVSSAVDGRQFSFHLCSRFSCGLDNRSPELYLSLQHAEVPRPNEQPSDELASDMRLCRASRADVPGCPSLD